MVTVEEGVTATTTATGNAYTASVDGTDLSITSNQTMSGDAFAGTEVNVASDLGESSTITTAATGNTGDAGITSGTMSGVFNQLNDGVNVEARSWIEGQNAQAGDITSATQAIANSQGLGLVNGSAGARISQQNSANTSAEAGVVMQYTPGESSLATSAAGNNATSVGVFGSAQRLETSQNNTAAETRADSFAAYGNSYISTTSATATGNNVSITNEGGLLEVANSQNNESAVGAEAEASSYDFGAGTALAYGVGNSALAGNAGPELIFDNVQNNEGGVEVVASFTGNGGYDATTSSTAMGNAVTGYACAVCEASMAVNNTQTNSAAVRAQSSTTVTGSARSVTGVATAVGNSGTFYVTRPPE